MKIFDFFRLGKIEKALIAKCSLCPSTIRITNASYGWRSEPDCVQLWNDMFASKQSFYICDKHRSEDVKKFAIKHDVRAITNGFSRWEVK